MSTPQKHKPPFSLLYRFYADSWAQHAHEIEERLEHDPDNLELHLVLAWRCSELEWFDQAMREFDEILRLDPRSDFAFAYRGLVRAYLGDFQGALADLALCLEIRPDCTPAILHRARVKAMMEDWHGAIEDFTLVLERELNSLVARWNRAEIYRLLGKRAEALADYKAAIKVCPHPETRQYLWQMVLTVGN